MALDSEEPCVLLPDCVVCVDRVGGTEGSFHSNFSLDPHWQYHWRPAAACTYHFHPLEGMNIILSIFFFFLMRY